LFDEDGVCFHFVQFGWIREGVMWVPKETRVDPNKRSGSELVLGGDGEDGGIGEDFVDGKGGVFVIDNRESLQIFVVVDSP
jgi:hypothetical protein